MSINIFILHNVNVFGSKMILYALHARKLSFFKITRGSAPTRYRSPTPGNCCAIPIGPLREPTTPRSLVKTSIFSLSFTLLWLMVISWQRAKSRHSLNLSLLSYAHARQCVSTSKRRKKNRLRKYKQNYLV